MKQERKTGENNTTLEKKAADILISKPFRFSIDGVGDFEIKKIPLGVWVMISNEALKINHPESGNILNSIASARVNALPIARIIATAILWNAPSKVVNGKKVLGLKIKKDKIIHREELIDELAAQIFNNVDAVESFNLLSMIVERMNPGFFFNSTSLLNGIRIMEPTMQATTASGAQ